MMQIEREEEPLRLYSCQIAAVASKYADVHIVGVHSSSGLLFIYYSSELRLVAQLDK